MPFDSNGVFTRVMNWTSDQQNGIAIECGRHDQEDDNFAQGFNDTFCRDGRAVATGAFNMGTHKIQNLGNGSTSTDAINKGQLDSAVNTINGTISTLDNAAVKITGDQTIAGTKTFSSTIAGSINGNAATVTNGVYTTGNQTIGGTKTFSSSPLVPTASTSDNSTKAASTAFVKAQGYVPSSSFEEVAVVVESYQGTSDWYRVWSDGWIEQGGKSSSRSWTYPKPFSSATSYTIISNNSATTDGYGRPDIIDCTATGATADVNAAAPILWIAMGK